MYRLETPSELPGALRRWLAAGAVLLTLSAALLTSASPAQANGTPIRIVLSYLNGVSNFGPQNATGVAEMITSEGEVRLTAAGLQKLADNETYMVWINTANPADRMTVGSFDANDAGVARLDTVMRQPIPEKAWELMVVTVEAKGAAPTNPSEKRAIAGRFSMTPGGAPPKVLPNTGGETTGNQAPGVLGLSGSGTLLLGLLAVGVIGFALGRVGSRRGSPSGASAGTGTSGEEGQ